MQRFEEVENYDVEGVDNKNACYGGTAALMNTINWVESSSWDGRLGIVICAGKAKRNWVIQCNLFFALEKDNVIIS